MKKFFVVSVLMLACVWGYTQEIQEQEEPQEQEFRLGEIDVHIIGQFCGHNYMGDSYSVTGFGIYAGYSHFFKDNHRLSGGVELTYRNGGGQVLFIPDYHYEWQIKRFRTAVGMELMIGYCRGFGFAYGLQPNVEFGVFVSQNVSLKLGIGYRMMGYPSARKEVGKFLGEFPITFGVTF